MSQIQGAEDVCGWPHDTVISMVKITCCQNSVWSNCTWVIISCDSCVWAEVCCSYTFPLIVTSVCFGGLKALWNLIGMLLAHSLRCNALLSAQWQDVMSQRLQVAGSLDVWGAVMTSDPLSSFQYKNQRSNGAMVYLNPYTRWIFILIMEMFYNSKHCPFLSIFQTNFV